jgi:hypothetical protein
MDSKESWRQVVEKLQKLIEPGYVRQSKISGTPSSIHLASAATLAQAEKGELLNVRDAVERIQHELSVSQFAARETLVKACGSGRIPVEYVLPNGGVVGFCCVDPVGGGQI